MRNEDEEDNVDDDEDEDEDDVTITHLLMNPSNFSLFRTSLANQKQRLLKQTQVYCYRQLSCSHLLFS